MTLGVLPRGLTKPQGTTMRRFDAIQDLDNDLDAFRTLGDDIKQIATPEDLPALLAMLKRVSHQDDYGIMNAFGSWIETLSRESKIAGHTVGEHLLNFTSEATNWKILELLDYFSDDLYAVRDTLSKRIESDDITDKERGLLEMTLERIEETIEEEE